MTDDHVFVAAYDNTKIMDGHDGAPTAILIVSDAIAIPIEAVSEVTNLDARIDLIRRTVERDLADIAKDLADNRQQIIDGIAARILHHLDGAQK